LCPEKGGKFTVVDSPDGHFISWSFENPISKYMCSLAVIVKGSNAAKIYLYGPDIYRDVGLVFPSNNRGQKSQLSNFIFY
jgi:hypothetical protein